MVHAYCVSENMYYKFYWIQYNNICTYSWGVEIDKQARIKHKQNTEAGFSETTPDFEQVPLTTVKKPKPVCSCLLGVVICLEGFLRCVISPLLPSVPSVSTPSSLLLTQLRVSEPGTSPDNGHLPRVGAICGRIRE